MKDKKYFEKYHAIYGIETNIDRIIEFVVWEDAVQWQRENTTAHKLLSKSKTIKTKGKKAFDNRQLQLV